MRVFIAVELPGELQDAVYRSTTGLRQANRDVRWVPARNTHLTLKFLGDISERQVESVTEAVRAAVADQVPFGLRLAEVGGFPTLARPRVVWIGVQGETNALAALARRLDGELHRVGFPRETRAFRAHLTLGRCKRPATLVDSTLVEVPDRPFVVDHAVVMESRLSPHGAEYHALKVLPFDGGSPGNRLPDTG